jgi:5-formyltetrahydrofolate cyclo-ligase
MRIGAVRTGICPAPLRGTPAWQAAGTLKANPDSAQLPVRQRALEDGKTVYMAVPRPPRPA